ncbi:hypothetical protein PspLS_09513, partial [Pyricularia sp. CBS 133598]
VSRSSYFFLVSPRGDILESTVVCLQNGRRLVKVRCPKGCKPTERRLCAFSHLSAHVPPMFLRHLQ